MHVVEGSWRVAAAGTVCLAQLAGAGARPLCAQDPTVPDKVVIEISAEMMTDLASCQEVEAVFLTSAKAPLRALSELTTRGFKIGLYEGATFGGRLPGCLLGFLRHVQTETPWQFDVLSPGTFLEVFGEDPPVPLVVTYRRWADAMLVAGGAREVQFRLRG